MLTGKIKFPKFKGIKINMMPFIQGDSSSIPEAYKSYSDIINSNYLEKGEIGFLTIDESFVNANKSQRGFNSLGINRNVHIEVGHNKDITCWGGTPIIRWGGTIITWGKSPKVILDKNTKILISNSLSDTCKYWEQEELRDTPNGDLSQYIDDYPEKTGILMKKGEMIKLGIFNPHECINQLKSENRQFFRIVGKGVNGREDYFTINPLMN